MYKVHDFETVKEVKMFVEAMMPTKEFGMPAPERLIQIVELTDDNGMLHILVITE